LPRLSHSFLFVKETVIPEARFLNKLWLQSRDILRAFLGPVVNTYMERERKKNRVTG